jgi:hypothetical protein
MKAQSHTVWSDYSLIATRTCSKNVFLTGESSPYAFVVGKSQ